MSLITLPRLCVYRTEIVGSTRSLEERRSKGLGGQGQRSSIWILKFTAAAKVLNFTIVCDSVNPSVPLRKQFTLGCSIKCGSVAFFKKIRKQYIIA